MSKLILQLPVYLFNINPFIASISMLINLPVVPILTPSPPPSNHFPHVCRPQITLQVPNEHFIDYAVPHNHAPPSTGPPSTLNLTSSPTSSPEFYARNQLYAHHTETSQPGVNGNLLADNMRFQPYRDPTPTPSFQDFAYADNLAPSSHMENHMTHAEHARQQSITTSHTFMDTLSRVHTPPLNSSDRHLAHSQQNFGSGYFAKTLLQKNAEPPWNQGEFNTRGHMTNTYLAKSDSIRSTESTNSMEFRGPSQLEVGNRVGQEHPLDVHNRNYLTCVDQIQMEEHRRGQSSESHSSREGKDRFGIRPHRVGMGYTANQRNNGLHHGTLSLGNEMPPTVTTYGPGSHGTASTPSTPDNLYDIPPSRQVPSSNTQQPPVIYHYPPPSYAAPPPPSPQYAIPPSHNEEQLLPSVATRPPNTDRTLSPSHSKLRGTVTTLPPSSKETTSYGIEDVSSGRRLHVHPLNHAPYKPHFMTESQVGPKTEYNSQAPMSGKDVRHLHVLPLSLPPPAIAPPTGGVGSAVPGTHFHDPQHSISSLTSIESGWSLDKIQRNMEQKAQNFEKMLTPPNEVMENHWQLPPQKTAHLNGHTSHQNKHHIKTKSESSTNHTYTSDEDTFMPSKRKHTNVPDLTTLDPRKPHLKVKKAPRSVWQPCSTNRAIQSSSSEESDDSDYSVDTVVGQTDTSTLRSAHV